MLSYDGNKKSEEFVYRPRIDKMLTSNLKSTVIVVEAPSGYGKSLSIRNWASNIPYSVVWVDLSGLDNKYNFFVKNLLDVIKKNLSDSKSIFKDINYYLGEDSKHRIIADLSETVLKLKKLILIFDNFEVIDNVDVQRVINSIIDTKIDNLTTVVISNKKIDLIDNEYHNSHINSQITYEDLKFNKIEMEDFFRRDNLYLSKNEINKIYKATEGYPYALDMIKHYLVEKNKNTIEYSELSLIADKLFELSFNNNYDNMTKRIFVKISLLEDFTLDLLKEIVPQQRPDIQDIILNHMFVNLKYTTNSFYIHSVYKRFLNSKLGLLTTDEINDTYKKAGDYFCLTGRYYEAVEYYFIVGLYDECINCLHKLFTNTDYIDNIRNILRILKSIPDGNKKRDPKVHGLLGICYLLVNDYNKSYDLLKSSFSEYKDFQQDDFFGEIALALGIIEFKRGSSLCIDRFKAAEIISSKRIIKTNYIHQIMNPISVFFSNNVIRKNDDSNMNIDIVKKVTLSLNIITENSFKGLDDLYVSKLYSLKGDYNSAIENVYKCITKSRKNKCIFILIEALFLKMRIMLVKGKDDEFWDTYKMVIEEYDKQNDIHILRYVNHIKNWVFSMIGDLSMNPSDYYIKRPEYIEDSDSIEQQELICHAYLLIRHEEFSKALGMMEALKDDIHNGNRQWLTKLKIYITNAVCYYGLNDFEMAYKNLYEAYCMAYENDVILPFIEYNSYMRTLVGNTSKYNIYSFDKEWVELIRKKSSYFAKFLSSFKRVYMSIKNTDKKIKSLTKREKEILRLLSKGFTFEEISKNIYISTSTVSKHISNIYKKLDVVNRAEAIQVAMVNKLI